nr:hypothetical protein [Myxococcota bacterium]
VDACPAGQERREDTHGRCCWPEQAWLLAKQRCVGTPRCPPAMQARGDGCVAGVAATPGSPPHPDQRRPPVPKPVPGTSVVRSFTLRARSVPSGGKIHVKFPAPARSPKTDQLWITVVEPGQSTEAYGRWQFVDDGATTATLDAPARPGRYEVRLHANYPAQPHDVQHALPITVTAAAEVASDAAEAGSGSERDGAMDATPDPSDPPGGAKPTPRAQQRFELADGSLRSSGKVRVRFAAPLYATPGERFWITVVPAGASGDTWGSYQYVPTGARAMALDLPEQAGAYELRLHANYPKLTTNVVHRLPIRVE